MDSTASPKRPEGVIGAFRSTLRSASLRSAKFSQRCLCRTTMKPMALPTDWAARFVAINAKSVAARRFFVASGVRTPPSAVCRSFAWNTCSTAMACNADAASPSEAYALLARWAVVLHGFEGRPMSEPRWTWPRRPPRGQRLRIPRCWKGGGNSPRGRKSGNAATVGFDGTARRREVRAKSTVGLVQRRLGVGQAQAGDAMEMLIQRFDGSRADLTH